MKYLLMVLPLSLMSCSNIEKNSNLDDANESLRRIDSLLLVQTKEKEELSKMVKGYEKMVELLYHQNDSLRKELNNSK